METAVYRRAECWVEAFTEVAQKEGVEPEEALSAFMTAGARLMVKKCGAGAAVSTCATVVNAVREKGDRI